MQITEAVRTYLLAQPALTAIVGSEIHPERAPQETAAPFITYHVELRETDVTTDRVTRSIEATFEFVVISADYDEAFQIAELLRTLLNYFTGIMGGTSGLQVYDVQFDQTVGGYADQKTAELGEFGTLSRFVIYYSA